MVFFRAHPGVVERTLAVVTSPNGHRSDVRNRGPEMLLVSQFRRRVVSFSTAEFAWVEIGLLRAIFDIDDFLESHSEVLYSVEGHLHVVPREDV